MIPKLPVPMTPCGDVKVPLHLVSLQTPVYPTSIRLHPPFHLRRLGELPAPLPHLAQHVADVRVLLLGLLPAGPVAAVPLVLDVRRVHVQRPARRVARQHLARQDQVARRVLHVDAQVVAPHQHHGVEVDLQRVRHALFHAELLRLRPGVPAAELGQRDEQGGRHEEDRGVSARARASGVGWFGFCCSKRELSVEALRLCMGWASWRILDRGLQPLHFSAQEC